MHLGEVRVWVWIEDGAVATYHAVLFEHAHLVDHAALDAVGGVEDLAVHLVLHVHGAFGGATEDQMGCILGFSTHVCLGYARLVLVVELCAECFHVHFLAFQLRVD